MTFRELWDIALKLRNWMELSCGYIFLLGVRKKYPCAVMYDYCHMLNRNASKIEKYYNRSQDQGALVKTILDFSTLQSHLGLFNPSRDKFHYLMQFSLVHTSAIQTTYLQNANGKALYLSKTTVLTSEYLCSIFQKA